MSLSNFFRINLPYGIAKNKEGKWTAFNREYLPLGFNDQSIKDDSKTFLEGKYENYPIYTSYKQFTKPKLKKILSLAHSFDKDENEDVTTIWFYNDRTNPTVNEEWDSYFEIIKILSGLERKD